MDKGQKTYKKKLVARPRTFVQLRPPTSFFFGQRTIIIFVKKII